MATHKPELAEASWPGMEVAIEAEGLSPVDISPRHLAALLEAFASLFERVAEERGVKVATPPLVELRTASAAYSFRGEDSETAAVAEEIERHARTRGVNASAGVRTELARLQKTARGKGVIRLTRLDASGGRGEPLRMAPPIDVKRASYEESREIFGIVAGVVANSRNGLTVRIRVDDGATLEFDAELTIAQRAARRFMRGTRALVTYVVTAETEADGAIEEIEDWDRDAETVDAPLSVFDEARAELAIRGIKIRASDWLAELAADDEEP